MVFQKTLAMFYRKWLADCIQSAQVCDARGDSARAEQYRRHAAEYTRIIELHGETIDFFSKDDNAFKLDSALPEKFRGYK